MRRSSIARPNPLNRIRANSETAAQVATVTPDTAAAPQRADRGAVDTGSMDGSDVWQPNGRLDIDDLDGEMRLA